MYQNYLKICFILVIFAITGNASADEFNAKVIKVMDGDTVRVITETGKAIKIRLSSIDAPEKRMVFGQKSRRILSNLINQKNVKVVTGKNRKDQYNRVVATLYIDGKNVNHYMVQKGAAWVWEKYNRDRKLSAIQRYARRHKIGLWSKPNPKKPWQWRWEQKNQ